jgi:carbamoyl-phosphate synthase small subunit
MQAVLALETGQVFYGTSIGVQGITVGEVVFNTALTGYQEILTDPSYCKQLITFTYPHIGNTGINFEDNQASNIFAAGLIIKSLSKFASNWRSKISLAEFLQQQNVVGIADIDTRGLTTLLRQHGSMRGCIMAGAIDVNAALDHARAFSGLNNLDLASKVTTNKSYEVEACDVNDKQKHVVLIDFGVKQSIIDCLTYRGCRVTVMPAQSYAAQILELQPDGIVLSNGPGDPSACGPMINTIKTLISSEIPILGICLGHQLLALALGAKTYKMDFGHHGSNHPVQNTSSGKVMITSQNHGFAVDVLSLGVKLEMTHRSLFDNSLQGFKHKSLPLFSFQGHPEAGPGPHDALGLFDDFIQAVRKNNAEAFGFA